MNEVIRQIQAQRDDCVSELWNPDADDTAPFTGTSACFSSAPTYEVSGVPLATKVGDLTVPRTLYNGFLPADTLRANSGRDSDNNIIVYWSGGNVPADNSKCWLYVSRLNSWDENY